MKSNQTGIELLLISDAGHTSENRY
jgi:hypothetical protein